MAMAHQLKRLAHDVLATWTAMPKRQALRWYAAVLRNMPTILLERRFYSADHEMRGMLEFHVLGHRLAVDNTTPGTRYPFLRELFVRQIYFRGFKNLRFKTCLDLGCNIGEVSGLLRQLAGPQGKVVGIDPLPYPGDPVRARALATPGVHLHQGLVCNYDLRHDYATLHALCEPYGFDASQALTVDELAETYHLEHIDFLKMDIEGAEFAIFRDPARWLDKVDNLAMEVHRNSGDPLEIIQKLQQKGFRTKWLDDAGYPAEPQNAGYIYASKVGSLKSE